MTSITTLEKLLLSLLAGAFVATFFIDTWAMTSVDAIRYKPVDEHVIMKTISYVTQGKANAGVEEPVGSEPRFTNEDIVVLAQTVWGEARGCSTTEQAAVVWCVLNRVDSDDPFYPDNIVGVVSQEAQFSGYNPNNPIDEDIVSLVSDVLCRWDAEKSGADNVDRVLPKDYLWFLGTGRENVFRNAYTGDCTIWDWKLESPYE